MSWRIMSSTRSSEALFRHDDLPLPVEIRGIRGAKRLRLRLDEKRGLLKLTGPLRMNRKAALDWAGQQRAWVQAQLGARLPDEPFVPGALIPLEGHEVELVWDEHSARTPRLDGKRLVSGGHNLLYQPARQSLRRAAHWLLHGFPALVRRRWLPIAVAAVLLFGPALGSYVLPPAKANQPIGAAGSRVGPGWTAPMNRCDQGADDPSGSGEAG